jgi:cytoskeletal protein CcmA (bactofilin family)
MLINLFKNIAMAKNYEEEKNNLNIIGSGTNIKGNIDSNGDIRIDGTIEGNLKTKGKLVVGQIGKAEGEIQCKNAEISGTIEGKIVTDELLSLKSTAKIFGDIHTAKIAIEPGAVFTGTCNMGGKKEPVISIDDDEGKEKK